eukprot:4104713-Karenia_brevis.AAC.1
MLQTDCWHQFSALLSNTTLGLQLTALKKGFLQSRKTIKNLFEVDTAAQKLRLKGGTGAIVLFDFTAALPTIAHEMIWDTLKM